MYDLSTRDNWQLLLSESRTVTYRNSTTPERIPYRYTPISPIYATPQSHILLIGAMSNTALQHWFLGARASQYLYVSPSMTTPYVSGVQAADIKPIGLNRMTLVEFKDYGVSPYILQLDIPYWLEHISVEVWEYLDDVEPDREIKDRLFAIEEDLERIESKLDNYSNQ